MLSTTCKSGQIGICSASSQQLFVKGRTPFELTSDKFYRIQCSTKEQIAKMV